MTKLTLTSALALSLALTMPKGAQADLKDALIGVGVGIVASEVIRNEKAKNAKRKQTTSTRSASKPRAAPTLNSQYSRAEKVQIQSALNGLGYSVGTVDGSLGPRSREAIGQFQAARGEARTGQLTRAQYAALTNAGFGAQTAYVVDRPLTRNEVMLMQTGLQQLGFYTSRVDGQAGPGTRRARETFLLSQGRNPATTTQVQSAVLAASAAGIPVQPYLMQEATAQFQQANAVPNTQFGTPGVQPQQQQALFGTPAQPQQPLFGAQPQQQQALFGAPQPQQGFQQQQGFQPQQQQTLYGAPAPQQGFATQPQVAATPAPGTNQLFAPVGTAPQAVAPQAVQPQQPGAQVNPLFAPAPTQTPLAPQQQPGVVPQQQGTLDIYAGQAPVAPQQAPVAQAPAGVATFAQAPATQVPAGQGTVPVAAQQQTGVGTFFAPTPTGAAAVQQAPIAGGGLDVFSPNN